MDVYLCLIVLLVAIIIGIVIYYYNFATHEINTNVNLSTNNNAIIDSITGSGPQNGRKMRQNIVKDLSQSPRSKSEQFVIDIFEKHTGEKFPTVRPKWLIYNGKQLELDGYCEKLGLAVEFSGPMHTKWYPNKESHAKYLDRIKRDEAKIKICRENNVRLFVIDMRIPKHQMHTYVKSRLYDAGKGPRPANYIPEEIYAPDIDYSS
jgi:hypothetical protein